MRGPVTSSMAQIEASELLPNEHVQQQVAAGEVTQLSRGHAYAAEGDTFDVDGQRFEVTAVDERTLGDMTDADAQREGSADLEAYRRRLEAVHDEFEWNDDADIVRHRRRRRPDTGPGSVSGNALSDIHLVSCSNPAVSGRRGRPVS